MHWITILGVVLIAAGTILAYFRQNISNRFVGKHLRQSTSEKTFQIDKLVNYKNELLTRINEYQESLFEKGETINELTAQIDRQKESADEYQESLTEKDETINELTAQIDRQKESADEYQKSLTEKDETIQRLEAQVIPETGLSDVIAQAKSLCNEGKYDEACKIADDLRRENPDFGQAYFVLGTIEMCKERYSKGVELLNRAIQLKLPNEDKAWAFHNLGIGSLRKKDYAKAKEFFEKAVDLNSNMENSKRALKLLNDYLQTNSRVA
jgi:tetratricopeptide (TPR) repeat protein